MPDLAVMLNVQGRRCVIVGGGKTAARRARTLLEAGAEVTLIATRIDPVIRDLKQQVGDEAQLAIQARPYQRDDLAQAWLVVIATDDPVVNDDVAAQARQSGALVNRADSGATGRGDVSFTASANRGRVTLAVHTGGASASAAVTIRDQLAEALDPDWPRLLDAAAPYRRLIQQRFADPAVRRKRLGRLTDGDAMLILKRRGLDALREHYESLSQIRD